jgi:hypothetical protein
MSAAVLTPIVTLLVNGVSGPLSVPQGQNVSVQWVTANATTCNASATTATGNWNGAKALSGTQLNNVGPINNSRTLILTCNGPGGVGSDSVDLISTAPPNCEIPNPVDPPDPICAAPPTNTGSITWKWLPVANADQYELTIINTGSGATVNGPTWRNANGGGGYNCSSGTCSYTTANLSPGAYKSQLRARSTVNNCTTLPTPSDSQVMTLNVCPGTAEVRAKRVAPSDFSCAAVQSSSVDVIGTNIGLTPNVPPGNKTQNTPSAVSWNNVTPGVYTVSGAPPAGYILKNACWTRDINAPLSGSGLSANIGSTETTSWELGYTFGTPWTRGEDGEMTICTDVASNIPTLANPNPSFVLNNPGNYPGIVSYGNTYDFDGSGGGASQVSSTDWLAKEAIPSICGDSANGIPPTNWYQYFANKMDLSSLPIFVPTLPGDQTKNDFTNTINRVDQDLSLGGPLGSWNLGANKTLIIFVNGDVTIKTNITLGNNSFFALIANGDITVASTVGDLSTVPDPSLQGLYITSPTGKFITGTSTIPASRRLVVKGTVVAGGFTLQRDLDADTHNQDTPAEEFIYDPEILLTMPDSFKDLRVKWQEVAP